MAIDRDTRRLAPLPAADLELAAPGLVAALVALDAGALVTFMLAGARLGLAVLVALLPLALALWWMRDTALRLGAVTGKGPGDLIRERFGVRWAVAVLAALALASLASLFAAFLGLELALGILGVPVFIAVPGAALGIWALAVRAEKALVRRTFLAACLLYLAFVAAGSLALGAPFPPRTLPLPTGSAIWLALVGSTLTPWAVFHFHSTVVDHPVQQRDYAEARRGVALGLVLGALLCALVALTGSGAGPGALAGAELGRGLGAIAGSGASAVFALVLLVASTFSAAGIPVVLAYSTCDALGFASGLDRDWREAPFFHVLIGVPILAGAALAAVPWADPLRQILHVQALNGLLAVVPLGCLLLLAGQRRLMGPLVVGPAGWALGGLAMGITGVLALALALGWLGQALH
jgi:Mn2+/Fe2+ NRAMP family transporter